jgi:hypothetical protein
MLTHDKQQRNFNIRKFCYFCKREGNTQRECKKFRAAEEDGRNKTARIAKMDLEKDDGAEFEEPDQKNRNDGYGQEENENQVFD